MAQNANNRKIIPPYSDRLKVDKALKLSRTKSEVKLVIDASIRDGNDSASSDLLENVASFPSTAVLAAFASDVYENHEKGETDEEYETRLKLPSGWKLLTTARNTAIGNGYFGAAYYHAEYRQVVIVHRGTKSLRKIDENPSRGRLANCWRLVWHERV
jgi:hypothetical protein